MSKRTTLSRRTFLGTTAAAAAPAIVPGSALGLGRTSPANRITVGFIGVGSRGMSLLTDFLRDDDVQVVAVCDVDKGRKFGRGGYGQQYARERVEQRYAARTKDGSFKGCSMHTDYREVTARKDIDAVVIATTDHWHAKIGVDAVNAGKDVYCEKPITHHLREGRILVDAVKKNKRIWQTGSQQRSGWNFHRGVELVRNGLIGKVKHVEIGLPTGHRKVNGDAKIQDPPASLDYDFWCGPSKKLPFIPARFHFHWRWHLEYGGGQLTDWIGHHNDIAQWGLGMERSGPVEVEGVGFTYMEDRSVYDAPIDYEVKCAYAGGTTTSISNKHKMGTKWIGEDGWVYVNRGRQDASDKEWFKKDFDPGSTKVYRSTNHKRNFIDCVKSREECVAPAEIAHRSASCAHLGYLSHQVGRKIKWNPETEQVVGDDEANRKLELDYRKPWSL